MNIIEKFHLSDVRCFAGKSEFNIRPLTFLVGENSTGKSTVLACMQALRDSLSSHESFYVDFNTDPYQMGSFSEIVRKSTTEKRIFSLGLQLSGSKNRSESIMRISLGEDSAGLTPITKKVSWEIDGGTIKLNYKPRKKQIPFNRKTINEVEIIVKKIKPTHKIFNLNIPFQHLMSLAVRDIGHLIWLLEIGLTNRSKQRKKNLYDLASLINKHFGKEGSHDIATASVGKSMAGNISLESIAPIRSKPRRTYEPIRTNKNPEGEDMPFTLLELTKSNPEEWKEIKRQLREFGKFSGLFSSVNIKHLGRSNSNPFQLGVKVRGPEVNLIDVGYGVSQILPILIRMFKQKRTHFLIQQPEVHLHPKGQAELASLMMKNHNSNNNIFIIETHSDHMVNRARIEIMKGKIAPEDVSLIYLSPKKNSVSVHNITFDKEGNMKNVPAGYRSFFLDEAHKLMGFGI